MPKSKTKRRAAARNGAIQINCAHDAILPPGELKAHPKNPNAHSEAQVKLLAKVISTQGWRNPVVVSNRSGFIVKGHCRAAAARLLRTNVPVDFQDYDSEQLELADMVADNRIPELADMDDSKLAELIGGFAKDFDLNLLGFNQADLDALLAGPEEAPPIPKSVEENIAQLQAIKGQRRKGTAAVIAKTDTEKYLVVVFASRRARELALGRLGLPADERYVPAKLVRILKRGSIASVGDMPKVSEMRHAGATG